ncbi:MAG: oligopeptide transporter, OPT family [Acidobacteria bacterium]|jgi:putative OPT family oligopeptide transporter|nr:oligopeptide transporter, OPT family [Acidobacteriota bacterium]
MSHSPEVKGMPEGAFEVLPAGKEYAPYVSAETLLPEVTFRSVVLGLIMAVVFSAAAAFLGLKIGQVFEAAIPIAIIAVGVAPLFKRKSTILENVIVQSIGAASGLIVAGAIFTLPALFILGLDKEIGFDLVKIFMVSFLGGTLGVLFLIPFRKYFVKEMHGHFPFPEATATTQVLVAGEKGGAQAKILVKSMIIGGIFDFMVHSMGAFPEYFTSRIFSIGKVLSDKFRIELRMDVLSAVMGLGYIIGLKYTSIIAAGSMLSWFLLVPVIHFFGQYIPAEIVGNAPKLISAMNAEEIFRNYVRFIGIGAIAMAGVIGILKSSRIIVQAFGMGFKQMFRKAAAGDEKGPRTQTDLSMKTVILGLALTVVVIWVFFSFSVLSPVPHPLRIGLIATITVFVISFLFTSVAARAIAIVGTNPVSGMTMMTLILSSLVLVAAGLTGPYGMYAALLIGGVVCTALSMSGGFITDLKIGYWLGSTPLKQQKYKFLGIFLSSLTVGLVILLLNQTYGFSGSNALAAPQANAMAALIQPLMNPGAEVPWLLYGVGLLTALIMEFIGVPPLAFALGMYIPLELNLPLVIGGLIAHLISRSSKDKELASKRYDKGILISSGFIAGGAIIGVVSAILEWRFPDSFPVLSWAVSSKGELIALVMFIALAIYLYFDSRSARKED